MGLLERIRGEGAAAQADGSGAGLVDRLGSLARKGGALVDRVADGVKDVASRGLLKAAADAQARGNLGAAFYLAMEASEAEPGDVAADGLFWDLALAFERPEDARGSAANLVAHHAARGAPELAAQFFAELVTACGAPLIDASLLVRVVPELAARLERSEADAASARASDEARAAKPDAPEGDDPAVHRGVLVAALRLCVHPENTKLSPGMAMRVAELARPHDTAVAVEAARRALAAEDVHEAKRAKLVAMIRELDPDADLGDLAGAGVSGPTDGPLSADGSLAGDGSLSAGATLAADGFLAANGSIRADVSDAADISDVSEVSDSDADFVSAGGPAGAGRPSATPIAPIVASVSEAEVDRLTSWLEPAEDELEAIAIADRTDAEILPELTPIDDGDPARNHPQRIESPVHHELTEDEVDRMRARIERALGARDGGGDVGEETSPSTAIASEAAFADDD